MRSAARWTLAAIVLLSACIVSPLMLLAQQHVPETGSSKGIVLSPFYTSLGTAEDDEIIKDLSKMCGGSPDHAFDNAADIDAFRGMQGHGVLSVHSHGIVDQRVNAQGINDVLISTSQLTSFESAQDIIDDHGDRIRKYITPGSGAWPFWGITPKFAEKYGSGRSNRLIYVNACYSGDNPTMSSAFGGTYFGYIGTVGGSYTFPKGEAFFDEMTNIQQPPDQRTATIAYNRYAGGGGVLSPADSDLAISLNPLVNGDFEDAGNSGDHLNGWPTNFVAGGGPFDLPVNPSDAGPDGPDVEASQEEVAHGQYSARLGRWNNDPCPPPYEVSALPNPGIEPDGDDQMSQQVTLGSGGPGSPTKFNLTFWYNILSCDSSGGDQFYALIQDSSGTGPTEVPLPTLPWIPSAYPSAEALGWQPVSFDLSAWAGKGKPITIIFGVHQDGWGDLTATYVDDVSISCQ
ncbi:MAG TPA: hypothetical protein VMU16_01450 [Candidatus Binataceae bacterium]|nr:hypothetical protein [Candidatus Binataceae bacterium]